jgi:uncharacterized membrane protein
MTSQRVAGEDSVILAVFEKGRAAEHMVASLGRGFRKQHRMGHATALVITGNKDGSLKLTQSRVLSASGVVATAMRISLSVAVGFHGIVSSIRGAKGAVHEVRKRQSHVGADERHGHEILAQVGPHAALVIVTCDDQEIREAVVTHAADEARESWAGSRVCFLATLDPGPQHDFVRAALDEAPTHH